MNPLLPVAPCLPSPDEMCEEAMRGAVPPRPRATDRWKAWDDFLEETPNTGFMQSSWWADFRATVGFEHFGAVLKDRNGVVGGAMVQKFSSAPESGFYYIQDGPVLPDDEVVAEEVFAAILEAIESQRKSEPQTISHLRIEPRWHSVPGFVSAFRSPSFSDRFREPRNTLCVDLRPAEASILAQMKPKGRYNIRIAQRHGVSIVEDTSDRGLTDFLNIYQAMTTRQELGPKPPDYFVSLVNLLSPLQKGSIYFAEYQGTRLAAAVVVYFGRRATYFYGGSLDQHRHVMAPYLLHFEIMRRAKAMGCDWYDLWGVAPAGEPNHGWQNISVFKRKFGGLDLALGPTLDYIYDSAAYDRFAAGGRDSGAVSASS